MAITKMKMSQHYVGTTSRGMTMVSEKGCKPGGTMQVYVPELMPGIEFAAPVLRLTITKGETIFVNADECKITTPPSVRSRNYIEPKMENNASWNNIVEDPDKNNIPRGTNVTVNFVGENIYNPTFNTNQT